MTTAQKGNLLWSRLNCPVAPWILDAVEAQGYEEMTPVQASTIPLFTGNKDVVVEAVTGSGKTVSFVIPVLQRLCNRAAELAESARKEEGGGGHASSASVPSVVKRGSVFAMVVAPTRELAMQIHSVFEAILQYYPGDAESRREQQLPEKIAVQPVVGSLTTLQEDLQTFMDERPQIVVGTPGKVLEFLSQPAVKTREFDCLVLDEADRLLDMSFEQTVREIVRRLPRQKRVGLFSATVSSAGDMVFKLGMSNPVKVAVKSSAAMNAAPKALSIKYVPVAPADKIRCLFAMLGSMDFTKAIVYLPTCVSVAYFYAMFNHVLAEASDASPLKAGLRFFSIHGKLQIKPRMRALERFAEHRTGRAVLMATDVAARGIDIPDVDLVVQMDPPTDPDVFLHRCGRTGRANKVGKAVVMLNAGREEDYVDFMRVKKVDMEEEDLAMLGIERRDKLDSILSVLYGFRRPLGAIVERWVLGDRARYDLSVRAYVGFVRYYSKHSALSIFRMESLDYVGLAKAYGLIRLPRMPETRHVDPAALPVDGWLASQPVDLDEYRYLNEQKETARREELQHAEKKKREQQRRKETREANTAWSNQTSTKETRGLRREKTKRRRDAMEQEIKEKTARGEPSSSEEDLQEDWKDMVRSKKQSKKGKRGAGGAVSGSFEGL